MAKTKQQDEGGEPKLVRANVNRRSERSESFASVYANDAQFRTSPWDVRVTFGEIVGVPSDGDSTLLVRELCDVRMSPQFAKRVVTVLIKQIQFYERTVGPIPLPDEDE